MYAIYVLKDYKRRVDSQNGAFSSQFLSLPADYFTHYYLLMKSNDRSRFLNSGISGTEFSKIHRTDERSYGECEFEQTEILG